MSQTLEQTDASSSHDEPVEKQKSRRPPNNAFRQQRLKAWQPILTPKTVLPLFFAVGVIFAPIGGVLLWASSTVQELTLDYSECSRSAPPCGNNNDGYAPIPSGKYSNSFKTKVENADLPTWCRETIDVGVGGEDNNFMNISTTACRVQFYIPDELAPPVLFYYQLTNFYQNHRRYVQSFDESQLKGNIRSAAEIEGSNCDPLQTEIVNGVQKAYYPCGLIANSMFNDTFMSPVLLNGRGEGASNGVTYNMTNKGIAWSTDDDLYGNAKYKNDEVVPPVNWRVRYPTYNETFPIPKIKEWEEFHVWMRTAGLPTFSKLALRNDNEKMEVGRYEVVIHDYFPVTIYSGTKSILLSTRTVMGGKNPFLGITYIVVGGLCIILGALFTVTQLIKPRKLGDHSYLTWNTEQPSTATTTGRAPRSNEAA
ncbi:unnamed protein product [Zymoseptoria tritici ST99CH_1A5]|uniref:Uncharacterized protein n=4 Tax=Zymoseptoria tritici TaxID=1047171 RepID=F9X4M8_ZYMTI|nr:uncharacterized protein MYCGRDRAFT_108228 [Zymoseptoria tritici IPO323]SMQ47967.1 unnamed protein product [Zymoseptoria tritici ST99CH_3D7]SMR46511.1 unnamed protein product [Zymoseptoria tritici ST99CH_1E4]SMR47754.1 unnamed protein product [Zymoseptoria tritici ST99CH_3D1]SMY21657.1 unnamed protein product [Zymoseptoria tritici ST99CH_1A5]EGP90366.1 hypothetical protein MYCGRDRAFT_108228 [Zymoseptoria tritici IPO323]